MSLAVWALGLALWAVAATPNPLDDLRDCADRMRPEQKSKSLAEQCPNLDATLAALGLNLLLDPEERKRLDSDALRDLVALSSQYSASLPASGPSAGTLAAIAEQVNGKQLIAPTSWWERLKAWIKGWFSHSEGGGKNWFDDWVRRMSDSHALLNLILYTCMGVVIVGALAVMFIEVRAAGLLRGKVRITAPPLAAAGERSPPPLDGRSGVVRLLGQLVDRLIATRRLQFERTLTHRELVARSLFDTPEQRSAFAQVSQAAEVLTYGGLAEAAIPRPIVEQGSELLSQLSELPMKETL